jgi:hypothetical protein
MSFMLPSPQNAKPKLADVLPSCLASLGVIGFENHLALRPVRSAIVVIVDGLGAINLSGAKAHARFLGQKLSKASTISTVFPSTTAAALPSFTTGVSPGEHGMLGYRVRVPESGLMVNQLTGLDSIEIGEPWLRATPLYSEARQCGIRPVIVSKSRFTQSSLTKVIHAGADVVGAASIAQRCDEALAATQHSPSLVVLYISELDEIAHASGVGSHTWASKLEEVDAELARLAGSVAPDVSVIMTADHGVLDIAPHGHVLYGENPETMTHIVGVGGEPRCLQLYLDAEHNVDSVARRWQEDFGDLAHVVSRTDIVASGWLGRVLPGNLNRLGDVFVLARKEVVFFDFHEPTSKARNMIGHHGGISAA